MSDSKRIPASFKGKSLLGLKFGRLKVIGVSGFRRWFSRSERKKKREIIWSCACDCGNLTKARGPALKRGEVQSCGCYRKERLVSLKRVHGMSQSGPFFHRTYWIWVAMRQRCFNPRNCSWKNYGAKGIRVCDRWLDFRNFLEDMGLCPDGYSLDRFPDKFGNYHPGNCRWATPTQQSNNTSRNVLVTHNGLTLTLAEWSKRLGVSYAMIQSRNKKGVPPAKLFK